MRILPQWPSALTGSHQHSAIGLEMMYEAVNVVQLDLHRDQPCVCAAATLDFSGEREQLIDNPTQLRELLRPVLRKQLVGRRVHSCLPPEYFKLFFINYRSSSKQNDTDVILQQMRERLDGDLSQYVIDYMPVRTTENSDDKLALVSVSPREAVIRYLDCLHRAGLDVQALEIGPVALNRLLASLSDADHHDNNLSITFGQHKSYLSVHSGRRLLLDREVDFGENQVIQQLCQVLEVDADFARRLLYRDFSEQSNTNERLVQSQKSDKDSPPLNVASQTLTQILNPLFIKLTDEINKALVYTSSQTRGEPVRHIFLLGSAAHWPTAGQLLGDLVNIPVHTLYPIARYGPLQQKLNIPPHLYGDCLAVATGLALRGIVP